MVSNYGSWSLPQLKEELKKRKAKLSERKRELIERLEAYDRNQDFGGQEDLGEDFSMSLPELSKYKDMNTETEFVDFRMGAVETYLEQMDKSLDCDAPIYTRKNF
ncbi:unnamed protein product [Mytilus coruscus]|uniref:SAP domain-containing protein n=1 Tax=Mytilus coruscus TaxID=42192 RepID=A0A6J8E1L1_MYTCO|nr:unnamed protein product [Mytilus coruscus]